GVPDISDSGINNQSIVERFYGAAAAKYDQIPGLARPCHHLDNFFEWKKTTTGKQPYAIALANRRLMGMGKPGARPPAREFAASRSSPPSRTPCAPSSAGPRETIDAKEQVPSPSARGSATASINTPAIDATWS